MKKTLVALFALGTTAMGVTLEDAVATGTGTLTFEGETENCTYTDSEIIDASGNGCPYYMEDGFLVLNLEDNILCYCQKN